MPPSVSCLFVSRREKYNNTAPRHSRSSTTTTTNTTMMTVSVLLSSVGVCAASTFGVATTTVLSWVDAVTGTAMVSYSTVDVPPAYSTVLVPSELILYTV